MYKYFWFNWFKRINIADLKSSSIKYSNTHKYMQMSERTKIVFNSTKYPFDRFFKYDIKYCSID